MTLKDQLDQLIIEDKLAEAINILIEKAKETDLETYDELISLKSRFFGNEKDLAKNIISREEYNKFKSQHINSFQLILNQFFNGIHTGSSERQPKYLTPAPPFPEFCIGRDKMLEDIHQKLCNGKNLLLVNGLGGMGKTTIALQYLAVDKYRNVYQHIGWISLVNQSLTDTLISGLFRSLEIELQNYPDKKQQLDAVSLKLANLPGNNLLIIDNANNAKELISNEKLLNQLRCKILITSRAATDNYAKVDVDELDMEDTKQVFMHHYTGDHEPGFEQDLEKLLTHIDRHTLFTELLAKAGKKKGINPGELLALLQQTDIAHPDLNRTITVGFHAEMTDREKETKLFEYINSLFEPEKETEENKDFLRKFCLLANMDVPLVHLKKMWQVEQKNENDFEDFMDNLIKTGWLICKNHDYRLHSLMASVIKEKLKPNSQNCKDLIDSLASILSSEHLSFSHFFTVYSYLVINNLNEIDFQLGLLCILLSDTLSSIGSFNSAVDVIEKAEGIFSKIKNIEAKQNLGICYERKANIFENLGFTDKILELRKINIQISKELCDQRLFNDNFKNNLAISYEKLGNAYSLTSQLDLALENYKEGNQICLELHKKSPKNTDFMWTLLISYEKLGDAYLSIGKIENALEYYKNSIELARDLCNQKPNSEIFKNSIAIAHSKLGFAYSSYHKLELALEEYKVFNLLMNELCALNPNNVSYKYNRAISFDYLGSSYFDYGMVKSSLECYKEFYGLIKELHETHLENEIFTSGLAISNEKFGDCFLIEEKIDLAIDYYIRFYEIFKNLYFQDQKKESIKKGFAISNLKLGESYFRLNRIDVAFNYFEEYHKLTKELYIQNSKSERLKSLFAISYGKLGDCYCNTDKLELALECYEKYNLMSKEVFEKNPINLFQKNKLANSYSALGVITLKLNRDIVSLEYFECFNNISKELFLSFPKDIEIVCNYAESMAIVGSFKLKTKDFVNAETDLNIAREIWVNLVESTKIKKFGKKLLLLDKMLEKGADLDRLIIEMSSF